MTRLVEDRGCSISGGLDTCGRATAPRQSLGHDLARAEEVGAGLEDERIDERPGTD